MRTRIEHAFEQDRGGMGEQLPINPTRAYRRKPHTGRGGNVRISVKVAPGVRVSGRVGGHHHRHHVHSSIRPRTTRARGPWLRTLPPWRMPILSGGIIMMLAWCIGAMLFAELWIVEFEIWLLAWCAIGIGHACRAIYRKNVLGQIVQTATRRRERAVIVPDPYPQPVDLATLPQADPWDGQMRRRS